MAWLGGYKLNEFRAGYFSNGEKIILFNRETIPLFFERLPNLFDGSKIEIASNEKEAEPLMVKDPSVAYTLFEIKDVKLLYELKPLLQKKKVLEAVKVCTQYYGNKYKVAI